MRPGDLSEAAAMKLAKDVERRLAAVSSVDWAVVNTVLGHAIAGTDGSSEIETITDARCPSIPWRVGRSAGPPRRP
ncbi:hypothetical protein [Streptomyces mirabilis]|uniref:hypothetical protein n=1 Tax=Streptomyces mirabilis TaxID=68239 RepID=UPI003683F78A